MIVEILNVGIRNKGAELMLHAIMQKIKNRYPNAVFTCVASGKRGHFPIDEMRQLGVCPKLQAKGVLGIFL